MNCMQSWILYQNAITYLEDPPCDQGCQIKNQKLIRKGNFWKTQWLLCYTVEAKYSIKLLFINPYPILKDISIGVSTGGRVGRYALLILKIFFLNDTTGRGLAAELIWANTLRPCFSYSRCGNLRPLTLSWRHRCVPGYFPITQDNTMTACDYRIKEFWLNIILSNLCLRFCIWIITWFLGWKWYETC